MEIASSSRYIQYMISVNSFKVFTCGGRSTARLPRCVVEPFSLQCPESRKQSDTFASRVPVAQCILMIAMGIACIHSIIWKVECHTKNGAHWDPQNPFIGFAILLYDNPIVVHFL